MEKNTMRYERDNHCLLKMTCKLTRKRAELSVISFNTERRGVEAYGLGEELEKDPTAQPRALHGQTHLQTWNEPLWRHGELFLSLHFLLVKTLWVFIKLHYFHRLTRSSGKL